ncbi:MAG: (2Fe-2S)-binding protein [Acidobacteria bacterium]|nr:(2Fe-2S)-binding protein [Acidobacteriota bacterium]
MSVRIHFLLEDLEAEAPEGVGLAEVAEAVGADITFGCRTGSCGTCRIRLARGLKSCSAPDAEERDFLAGLGSASDQRLACRVKLHGDVAIEYLGV